jgi:predicted dehydrogenase
MTIHMGIIGLGGIADDQHAPALEKVDEACLWSVLSRDMEKAQRFAMKHGASAPKPAYSDLVSFLSDENLDAVIITSPDKLHAKYGLAAAEAGKHVLIEKPMSTDVHSCRMITDACARSDIRLGVAYHLRWHDGHRLARQAILAGKIGQLEHIRVHWTMEADPSNWRARPETGRWWSLAANGTHCLDLVRWMMIPLSGEIENMTSLISRSRWHGPHDETAMLSLRFENGATAQICSSVRFKSRSKLEMFGTQGEIICDDTLGRHGGGAISINNESLRFKKGNPFIREIEDFVKAIQEHREPEVSGQEGTRNVELLEEAVRQSESEHGNGSAIRGGGE